jgi:hypothetical protein
LEEDPWRIKKEEVPKNGLRVLVIDLGKFNGCTTVFLLYLLDVLVAMVSNSTEVDGEQYDYSGDNGGLSEEAGDRDSWDGDRDINRGRVGSNGDVEGAGR